MWVGFVVGSEGQGSTIILKTIVFNQQKNFFFNFNIQQKKQIFLDKTVNQNDNNFQWVLFAFPNCPWPIAKYWLKQS